MTADRPKAYLGNDKYVFISYSHKDINIAYEFISLLQERCNVWFDEGIHFGKEWDEDIVNKITHCGLFIYLITPNSLESKNCKDEIAFAKENSIPFINILLEPMELPSIFMFRYGRFQMCKYYEYKNKHEAIEELFRRSEDIRQTEHHINQTSIKKVETKEEHKEQYALFNFEKEITMFPIYDKEKQLTIKRNEYFSDNGDEMYRFVLLPSESMGEPVDKVEVREMELLDDLEDSLAVFTSAPYDARYSHNVLDRGYNCICVNILTDKDMFDLFSKTYAFKLKASIYSIQNVKLDVEFEIVMKNRKNTDNNPDVKEIPELVTYNIHHSHYKVTSK